MTPTERSEAIDTIYGGLVASRHGLDLLRRLGHGALPIDADLATDAQLTAALASVAAWDAVDDAYDRAAFLAPAGANF